MEKTLTMPESTKWWQVLNPAIYLVSILPAIAVWLITDLNHSETMSLIVSTCGVVLLQHAINLFNDAKDWQLGADLEKLDSWVRVHNYNTSKTNRHGVLSLFAGCIIGVSSLIIYEHQSVIFYAFPFVVLGLLYNYGKYPLSYTTVGEWVTGICYGPGVFGSLWFVAGQQFSLTMILGMVAFSAFSISLLLSHQPPQISTDRTAGKKSFAVRHGEKITYRVSTLMFSLALVSVSFAMFLVEKLPTVLFLFVFLSIFTIFRFISLRPNPKSLLLNASFVFVMPTLLTIFI